MPHRYENNISDLLVESMFIITELPFITESFTFFPDMNLSTQENHFER